MERRPESRLNPRLTIHDVRVARPHSEERLAGHFLGNLDLHVLEHRRCHIGDGAIRTVKAFGREGFETGRFAEAVDRTLQLGI